MSDHNNELVNVERLPGLIAQAAAALAKATTAAEILDAKDQATVAYDAAKLAGRLTKAREAHDAVVEACHKVMADALEIEAMAQCRLADEYDAAQERGEVATRADGTAIRDHIPGENKVATVADVGLTSRTVHEARFVRNAERDKPGIIRRLLDEKLRAGMAPTRADIKRAIAPKQPVPTPAMPVPQPAPAAADDVAESLADEADEDDYEVSAARTNSR